MTILVLFLGLVVFTSISITSVYSDDLVIIGNGNAPIYISNSSDVRLDENGDMKADYYVKAHYIGNSNQQLKIDYKIQDECVDDGPWDGQTTGGETFDDASLKFGLSTPSGFHWITEDVSISNSWFNSKKNDNNRQIDLAYFDDGVVPSTPFTSLGDDAIQGSDKNSSFKHFDSISELGDQPGWQGTIFLNAPVGNYRLWTIHPSGGIDGCDRLSGMSIPIFIKE